MSLHVVREKKPELIYGVQWMGRLADLSDMPSNYTCWSDDIGFIVMRARELEDRYKLLAEVEETE